MKGYREPYEDWDIYCEKVEEEEKRMWQELRAKEKTEQKIRDFLLKKHGRATPEMIQKIKKAMYWKIVNECKDWDDLGW